MTPSPTAPLSLRLPACGRWRVAGRALARGATERGPCHSAAPDVPWPTGGNEGQCRRFVSKHRLAGEAIGIVPDYQLRKSAGFRPPTERIEGLSGAAFGKGLFRSVSGAILMAFALPGRVVPASSVEGASPLPNRERLIRFLQARSRSRTGSCDRPTNLPCTPRGERRPRAGADRRGAAPSPTSCGAPPFPGWATTRRLSVALAAAGPARPFRHPVGLPYAEWRARSSSAKAMPDNA